MSENQVRMTQITNGTRIGEVPESVWQQIDKHQNGQYEPSIFEFNLCMGQDYMRCWALDHRPEEYPKDFVRTDGWRLFT